MERGWNKMFEGLTNIYRATLAFNEKNRWAALLVLAGVMFLLFHSFSMAGKVGFSMFTESDQGQVSVKLEFPTRYNLAQVNQRMKQIEARLQDLPTLEHILTMIGKVQGMIGQSSEGVYLAEMLLTFPDRDKREITIHELSGNGSGPVSEFAGMYCYG